MRELSAGSARRPHAVRARSGGRDRGGARDPAAGTTADLTRCLRLSELRPPGSPAWPRPLHARGRRSAHRRDLPVRRLALPALALRPAVHAGELRDRAAGARRRAVGLQGGRGGREPRRDRVGRAGRISARSLTPLGGRVHGPEPGSARAGRGRRPQRHADPFAARGRARAHGRRQSTLPRRRDRVGDGRGDQDHGRAGVAVPDPRSPSGARASIGREQRGPRPVAACGAGTDRLRHARAELSRRGRRTAAARGDPQRAGRDRSPGGAERDTELVAPPLHRRIRGGTRVRAVAHGTRCGLARRSRLDDARAAALDRLALALVRDLGAAASGGRRRSAPAGRHARFLRLCGPHPPAAGRPPAQPGGGSTAPRRCRRR